MLLFSTSKLYLSEVGDVTDLPFKHYVSPCKFF